MNEERTAVFKGTIGKVSTVPSRGVVIISIEVPIEEHELVARVASHGSWCAVARIQPPTKQETEKKKWNELTPASQAGILCNDLEFLEYLSAADSEQAIDKIYTRCSISSRAELSTNSRAAREWSNLVSEFRVWQQARP